MTPKAIKPASIPACELQAVTSPPATPPLSRLPKVTYEQCAEAIRQLLGTESMTVTELRYCALLCLSEAVSTGSNISHSQLLELRGFEALARALCLLRYHGRPGYVCLLGKAINRLLPEEIDSYYSNVLLSDERRVWLESTFKEAIDVLVENNRAVPPSIEEIFKVLAVFKAFEDFNKQLASEQAEGESESLDINQGKEK
ncbi:hypothetical protein GQ42DRAFT_165305 [Ramicandelaber brevisporus]|nr:hypothetical protein GQ42DRAFT_165305 [Ramicandelaber brevisporus]